MNTNRHEFRILQEGREVRRVSEFFAAFVFFLFKFVSIRGFHSQKELHEQR